ncbi:MAG: hypothetical protein ACOX6U_06755 [Oscillospiraceae bacterium]|jgi:hypothetical protein
MERLSRYSKGFSLVLSIAVILLLLGIIGVIIVMLITGASPAESISAEPSTGGLLITFSHFPAFRWTVNIPSGVSLNAPFPFDPQAAAIGALVKVLVTLVFNLTLLYLARRFFLNLAHSGSRPFSAASANIVRKVGWLSLAYGVFFPCVALFCDQLVFQAAVFQLQAEPFFFGVSAVLLSHLLYYGAILQDRNTTEKL